MTESARAMVAAGIDTHKRFHVMAITDGLGAKVGELSFPASAEGYALAAERLGDPARVLVVGIEGTGSYGAGVCRALRAAGYPVAEVCRPKRAPLRPGRHKSDPEDALRAAADALRGLREGRPAEPKSRDGFAEECRALLVAHDAAEKAATELMNAMCALAVSAPEPVRERLAGLKGARLAAACRRARRAEGAERAVWDALRPLARAWAEAKAGSREAAGRIREIMEERAPALIATFGVGPVSAAALAAAAGDNPQRLRGEGAFAALCGASPVRASTGGSGRHRLNRGGDRRANRALHSIAIVRMRYDGPTGDYVAKKVAEGKTKREAIRCLKRYIAREIYRVLMDPVGATPRLRR